MKVNRDWRAFRLQAALLWVPHFHAQDEERVWLDQAERWFAEIATEQLRCGGCRRTQALDPTINEYLAVRTMGL